MDVEVAVTSGRHLQEVVGEEEELAAAVANDARATREGRPVRDRPTAEAVGAHLAEGAVGVR